jgi:hypothetical protein
MPIGFGPKYEFLNGIKIKGRKGIWRKEIKQF